MRLRSIPLAIALVLPSGCCSMARFFCGPDRTAWVSVDYSTPEAAVHTLLEALRRDQPDEVYHCLSQGYRDRLGISSDVALAWAKVKEQAPGLHVAGYAQVPKATQSDPDHAHLQLDIEGHRLDVDIVRQLKWEVRYRRADGTLADPGQYLTSMTGRATIVADDTAERSTLTLAALRFPHQGQDEVPLDAIEFAGYVREWKIDRLTTQPDS